MSNCDATRSHPISQFSSHYPLFRLKGNIIIWYLLSVCLLAALLLAGCGPENSGGSQEELAETTHQIALQYNIHHDLGQANADLEALDVANLNQWLLYVTETAITNNTDASLTSALVLLCTDLGLQSNSIHQYALQHSLVEAAVALQPEVIVNPQPTPEAAATVAQLGVVTVLGNSASNSETSNEKISVENSAVESTTAVLSTGVLTVTAELPASVIITPTLAPTPVVGAQIKATSDINVRFGPGIEYPIAGGLTQSETASITGKNSGGDWWEVLLPTGQQGWVYGPLVETAGDITAVAVAATIPTPPPTATPAPTQQPAESPAAEAPAAEAPATNAPAAEEPAAPAPAGTDFRLVKKRLWDVVENGGQLNGPSVTCGEKRQLVVEVLDASGNRLNGVAVQEIYGAQEIYVTGAQGKGDGMVEYVLGGGQAIKIVRDTDGRAVTSEEAHGLSTKPWEIPFEMLIGGHFCTDDASCKSFVDSTGCYGHYSWTVTFQRSY